MDQWVKGMLIIFLAVHSWRNVQKKQIITAGVVHMEAISYYVVSMKKRRDIVR